MQFYLTPYFMMFRKIQLKRHLAMMSIFSMLMTLMISSGVANAQVLADDGNGNYLCDLEAIGGPGATWTDALSALSVNHLFFRTTATGDLAYGYGYGYSVTTGWKFGYGYGYGYDNFCNNFNENGGSRAGYFFFETGASPTMNLAAVSEDVEGTRSLTVPDDMALSLTGDGEGAELQLPAGLTMSAEGWDGTVDVAYSTSVPTGLSAGKVVSVAFTGASGAVGLGGAALVIVPLTTFSPSTGAIKVVGNDSVTYTPAACTGGQYDGADTAEARALVANYHLDPFVPTGHQECYTYDTTGVYIATNHFSTFAAGTATVASSGGGGPVPGGSGGSSGGSSGSAGSTTTPAVTTPATTPTVAPKMVSDFNDLKTLAKLSWQYPLVQQMTELGLMMGSLNSKGELVWNMNAGMTRAEAAVLIARYLGFNDKSVVKNAPFSDVSVGAWYASSVAYLQSLKVVSGKSANVFAPGGNVTRAEFFKMAATAYTQLHSTVSADWNAVMKNGSNSFADVKKLDWFYSYMNLAEGKKLMTGYVVKGQKLAMPSQGVSRVEAASILSKLLGLK